MIVCATPRCGGTIFCIEEARKTGADFIGELSSAYIKGIGLFRDSKARHHETAFQPVYDLESYVNNLLDLESPGKIFLVNGHISAALPMSSYRIATRDIGRAFQSLADLMIRANPDLGEENLYTLISQLCRDQFATNILIIEYCRITGKHLHYFEDLYVSKGRFDSLDNHPLKRRLNAFFANLKLAAKRRPS
jgi:hypothetical protein